MPSATLAGIPTMIPDGISWSVFSSAPVSQTSSFPTRVPTISMFKIIIFNPTSNPSSIATQNPSSLRINTIQSSPTQTPSIIRNTFYPSQQLTLTPTLTPTFKPTSFPSLEPTKTFFTTTQKPTNIGIDASSMNNASNGQNSVSSAAIGVIVACIIILAIIIAACAIYNHRKSKERMSPYQIWSSYYSQKKEDNILSDKSLQMNKDIHHFYNNHTPRPSITQNTVFVPHVSGRTSFRNSQIVSPIGYQKNSRRLSITSSNRGPPSNYIL
jgi:hypothetical protein